MDILDPQKENEYCYNRFAHMLLTLTEEDTNEELVQQDLLQLNLNYKDAEKIGVKYIASRTIMMILIRSLRNITIIQYYMMNSDGEYISLIH